MNEPNDEEHDLVLQPEEPSDETGPSVSDDVEPSGAPAILKPILAGVAAYAVSWALLTIVVFSLVEGVWRWPVGIAILLTSLVPAVYYANRVAEGRFDIDALNLSPTMQTVAPLVVGLVAFVAAAGLYAVLVKYTPVGDLEGSHPITDLQDRVDPSDPGVSYDAGIGFYPDDTETCQIMTASKYEIV